ncbi:hypothetical protein H0E87_030921, partial [Populus deltoides]
AAVYGIGICAGLGGSGSVFKPLVGGTFQVQCCNKSSQCTSFGQYNAILTMLFQLLEKYESVIGIAWMQHGGGHVTVLSGKRLCPVQVPTASASNVIVSWGCCCLCSASECCVLNFLSSEWFSICG